MDMKLLLGDSMDLLKNMEDNSVDSIVTDPPYGLSFMGKKWDYDVPSVEMWGKNACGYSNQEDTFFHLLARAPIIAWR